MTVIAWDGQTLAADKLACSGATRGTVTKIRRFGGELLAVAGNLSIGMEMAAWYEAGAKPADYPASNRNLNEGASLIVVKPDRTVWKYESSPYPFQCEGAFQAFGSGDESAKVAMACGKTAAEAVGLVSMFNTGCGNGCDTLRLD